MRYLRSVLLLLAVPAAAAADVPDFADLRIVDLQLAVLGDRLARTNAALCDRQAPATGLVLATIDAINPAYRDAAREAFGFATPVAVEGVVPGSAAAVAGLEAGDALETVNGLPVATGPISAVATLARTRAVAARLEALAPAAPIELGVIRAGRRLSFTMRPAVGCRVRFELLQSSSFESAAADDGVTVQVSSLFFARLPDEAVATFVAHEMAHVVLHHEQRLTAAGISGGMAGGFGRNVGFLRQTETQADILSVDLLANAGFAPGTAGAVWRRWGATVAHGALAVFADRSHPGAADRAATTAAEGAAIAADPARARHPPILASRDRPLDGDWQSILVRAR